MEFLKLRRQQQLERELNGYVDWICTAGKGGFYQPGDQKVDGKNQGNYLD